jgi:hypothetical protein
MSSQSVDKGSMIEKRNSLYKVYKLISLIMALTFALVGLIFLFMAEGVLIFFNGLSGQLGMLPAPVAGTDFYLVLAVAYMYVVTLLAYKMYRQPENKQYPVLLINAKTATSIISILLFIFQQPYLIYITNTIVDGSIALFLLLVLLKPGRTMS